MAQIFIVNHSISGPYAQCFSSYHHTETEAAGSFVDCKNSVGDDPALIQLIALDTETLEATTYCEWEGNIEDLEAEEAEFDAEMKVDDEDDGICEGAP